jgi:hypothetical protein
MLVKSRDPIRNRVSSFSSGPHYYNRVEDWYWRVSDVLREEGYYVTSECPAIHVREGRAYMTFTRDGQDGHVVFTWYEMDSGRYEVVGYIT